jgi:hypothetical protein
MLRNNSHLFSPPRWIFERQAETQSEVQITILLEKRKNEIMFERQAETQSEVQITILLEKRKNEIMLALLELVGL